jgi:tetratricopeptide (TPR) repeat protein
VITRFQKPFVGGRDVIGYRAMKLTTRKAPLNLRLLNQEGEPPDRRNALQLWATDSTFTNSPTPRDSLDGLGGKYRSGRPLEGIACVVVRLGAGRREPFPVPILGDDHTVTLRMAMSEQELARADHEQACEQLRGRALEALSAQLEIYKGLAKLIQEGENEKALKRAAAGLARATADLKDLQAELERLKADPTQDEISKRMLASAAEQVQLLAQAQPELEKKLTDLRAAVAKANDPIALEQEFRVGELTRQIGYHVGRGEIPEALELYDQLFEVTQQEQAKTLKQALIEQWKPKNDAVKTAREFLQEKWRKASTSEELETYLKEFPDHVATLAREDDRLGIRNAISSIQISYARLKEALDRLDENSETDRAAVAKIKKLSDSIRKVEETALAARDRLEPKKE